MSVTGIYEPALDRVQLTVLDDHIALVRMCDRERKNAFTEAFLGELSRAFTRVKHDPKIKAVVLTGYDSYFSSGGTQEQLLALNAGHSRFTDLPVYNFPLRCEVPVIAAMQGHAIGGGLVLGLYCDTAVLSRESIFSANFMRYGFTPGMGATCILPRRLGASLAQEMLLTARSYTGAELAARGAPYKVLTRREVEGHALELAEEIARSTRHSTVVLKRHFVAQLRQELSRATERELAMHEETFHRPEVAQRIRTLFGVS